MLSSARAYPRATCGREDQWRSYGPPVCPSLPSSALRSDGDGEEPRAATLDTEPRLIVSGISRDAARRLIAAMAQDRPPDPLDGRPRVVVLSEQWAGEIAT